MPLSLLVGGTVTQGGRLQGPPQGAVGPSAQTRPSLSGAPSGGPGRVCSGSEFRGHCLHWGLDSGSLLELLRYSKMTVLAPAALCEIVNSQALAFGVNQELPGVCLLPTSQLLLKNIKINSTLEIEAVAVLYNI